MSDAPSAAPWLSIVGVGEDGLGGVTPAARALVDAAEVLVGGTRHLAMIPQNHPAERLTWRSPLADTVAALRRHEGRAVCVLATGDPMSYGIGVTLGREFGPAALSVHPVAGAFSLAAARLCWPLEEVGRLTLHGRPLALLAAHLAPRRRLLILSENGETPAAVARYLAAEGYGESRLVALAHLGGAAEETHRAAAADWGERRVADLNTLAVECAAGPGAPAPGAAPGLPDDLFAHDGQLTKQEVRAATLAALRPFPGAVLWDVGAGAGSIAIEWMRAGGRALALEPKAARRAFIAENAERLGTPQLAIVDGAAPDGLDALLDRAPRPDAIFFGGGLTAGDGAERALAALAPGGRFVANAVTLEGEARLATLHADRGGAMRRIAVSRLVAVGPYHGWRPMMPVTQYCWIKPHE
ncbi:MAG: precorrin-6y C5,15-methyltransferase (decarboxylating) subunit CbiE [Marivibrio sp.]|uniref:precorrin-6y C5,15-methyltransferase (decarboxylating) subunit CbiE n=1 Tax=Marivibrio sp. TaxID=2039719 RepID=UPI0032ED651D